MADPALGAGPDPPWPRRLTNVEDSGTHPYDPRVKSVVEDSSYSLVGGYFTLSHFRVRPPTWDDSGSSGVGAFTEGGQQRRGLPEHHPVLLLDLRPGRYLLDLDQRELVADLDHAAGRHFLVQWAGLVSRLRA